MRAAPKHAGGGAAVEVESVSKSFETEAGPVHAVSGVSVEVPAASSLAVTGPSGCGKSTLLSMIGGLEAPSSGRVSIGGELISAIDDERRAAMRRERIGFVFQSHNLQPFLTAVENVSLQLALAGGEGDADRSVELLGSLGLAGAVGKYPDQLSGGERQRVAVARALVHRPDLVLADEPTGSLDVDNSTAVIDLLCETTVRSGATLIVITHDATVADRLDRRLRLKDGRVLADEPQEGLAAAVAAALPPDRPDR